MRSVYPLVLLLGAAAFGQINTGELSGSVRDPSGGLLPGATIVVEHVETGKKITAISNSAGEYLLPQLPVGVYSLTAGAANFKQSSVPRLEIHASDRLRRDFTLQLGDFNEVVTVEASDQASVEMVDTSSQSALSGTGASLVSLWQTGAVGLMAQREITWKLRRSTAVQYISPAAYKA